MPVKKGPAILLGSFVGLGAGIGIYWYVKKAKTRIVTLSVSPATGQICTTIFTATGKVTDGFGRPVANAQVWLWANGSKADIPAVTGPDGSYRFLFCFITGGAHVPSDFTDTITMKAQVDNYFSPETSITLTGTACQSCTSCQA